MTPLIAVLFAVMQGATELFPVSSLGHAVIVPKLLHWHIDQHAATFLPFVVMLHVGTATALLAYFWRDWWNMLRGVLGQGDARAVNAERGLLLRLVVATIPAVVIGFALKKPIAHLFASPMIAAGFIIINGGLLLAGEQLRRRRAAGGFGIGQLTLFDAFVIGLFQCLAFLPGLSRSGAAIVGGLTRGIDHEAAARFAFLMATPVIAGATVVEVPKLLHHSAALHGMFGMAVLAAVVAGVVAYLSTAFLMKYFRDHDRWALGPFAAYCGAFGVLSLVLLSAGI
ncbi:undecaprenyl-diphosphate phosphatase [Acidiphilium acidophilum]|uniref:Undecaprenyl-diphosphatase n=1 Tax=Acidiphilium acidophilum TaxID=76588 RepID=A0AAW9DPG4_ACIAO|nr:undecaprenyl-diphosphate phosphatase [Acidiphilium acidophilum]MDX5930986.1 undecaprenyl-diphosphate phosphatase [Acidiphilium acidophilum]MEE3501773.1 undecaprenyl-diphosphate phosphatase [Acidiphilium acidophilum]